MENVDLNNMYRQEPVTDCLIVSKIYGQCRQQECLKPRDSRYNPDLDADALSYPIDSAISVEPQAVTGFKNDSVTITLAANPILTSGYVQWLQSITGPSAVKIAPHSFNLSKIKVQSVTPSTFGPQNSWDIDIKYTFDYKLLFFDSANSPLKVVLEDGTLSVSMCAESTYVKTVTLNGGLVNCDSKVVMSGNFLDNTYSTTEPFVLVQGEANPLTTPVKPGVYVVGTLPDTTTWIRVDVNIGLFTMIKVFRLVNMMVQSLGDCQPDECKAYSPLSPCTQFKSIQFPFSDFDPPTA